MIPGGLPHRGKLKSRVGFADRKEGMGHKNEGNKNIQQKQHLSKI